MDFPIAYTFMSFQQLNNNKRRVVSFPSLLSNASLNSCLLLLLASYTESMNLKQIPHTNQPCHPFKPSNFKG